MSEVTESQNQKEEESEDVTSSEVYLGSKDDVLLLVENRIFGVKKNYLTEHSTTLKNLISKEISDSKQAKIHLQKCLAKDFELFLYIISSEENHITDENVRTALHISSVLGSKKAMEKCEKFLIEGSKIGEKERLELANQYGLESLKASILAKLHTIFDFEKLLSESMVLDRWNPKCMHQVLEKAMDLFGLPEGVGIRSAARAKAQQDLLQVQLDALRARMMENRELIKKQSRRRRGARKIDWSQKRDNVYEHKDIVEAGNANVLDFDISLEEIDATRVLEMLLSCFALPRSRGPRQAIHLIMEQEILQIQLNAIEKKMKENAEKLATHERFVREEKEIAKKLEEMELNLANMSEEEKEHMRMDLKSFKEILKENERLAQNLNKKLQ